MYIDVVKNIEVGRVTPLAGKRSAENTEVPSLLTFGIQRSFLSFIDISIFLICFFQAGPV